MFMEVTKVYLCCSRQGGLPMMPVQLKMFAGQPMMSGCCTRKFCGIVCRLGVLCFSSLAFKIVVVKTWDGSLRLNTELCYKFIVVAIFYISLCSNSLFCMFVPLRKPQIEYRAMLPRIRMHYFHRSQIIWSYSEIFFNAYIWMGKMWCRFRRF